MNSTIRKANLMIRGNVVFNKLLKFYENLLKYYLELLEKEEMNFILCLLILEGYIESKYYPLY